MDEWGKSTRKFQLVGDNWDKDIFFPIVPQTEKHSVYLFKIYAIVDRCSTSSPNGSSVFKDSFIEHSSLPFLSKNSSWRSLTYIFASAIIRHIPQVTKHFEKIFLKNLDHKHSQFGGIKTTQVRSISIELITFNIHTHSYLAYFLSSL